MTKDQIAGYNARLSERLAGHVAQKLGVPVAFARWMRLASGADVPVFRVPADKIAAARALGLTVEEGM